MMVGAGKFSLMIEIPQLQKYSHLEYMVDKLNLEMSDLQASDHLIKEIKKTLQSDFRKVDNWIHEKMRHWVIIGPLVEFVKIFKLCDKNYGWRGFLWYYRLLGLVFLQFS